MALRHRLIPPSLRSVLRSTLEKAASSYLARHSETWRLPERQHLERLLAWAKVDCVFDVGANAGQYAALLRAIGFKGPIISFEPLPELAKTLRENPERDPLWFIENVALSDHAGEQTINVAPGTEASSLLAIKPTAQSLHDSFVITHRQQIKTDTLAAMYARYVDKISFQRPFLKMDTQGYDLNVIAGGRSILDNFVGLQSEMAVVPLYEGAPDFHTSVKELEKHGFILSAIVPNNAGFFPRLVEFDAIMINSRLCR
jgi:FkbM family methyltransferase